MVVKNKNESVSGEENVVYLLNVSLRGKYVVTLISQVWAYFVHFYRKRPLCRAPRVVTYERVDCSGRILFL